ncbi:hypothetical protein, partial [Niastella populi]|uniref:hypothetical protein n=1 Tax=Niastella populi TaxID=550983 RepID=UPI001A998951
NKCCQWYNLVQYTKKGKNGPNTFYIKNNHSCSLTFQHDPKLMLVPGTQMHIVTFLFVCFESVLFFYLIIYNPKSGLVLLSLPVRNN